MVPEAVPEAKDRKLKWRETILTDIPECTKEELREAAKTVKNKKAPGTDRIVPEADKIAVTVVPRVVLEEVNRLLRWQNFPNKRKEAQVVLMWKK